MFLGANPFEANWNTGPVYFEFNAPFGDPSEPRSPNGKRHLFSARSYTGGEQVADSSELPFATVGPSEIS